MAMPEDEDPLYPRQRRVRMDNRELRRFQELNAGLLEVEFEGAPYPDSSTFVLRADVRFAEAAPTPEGFRLVRGDVTRVVLPAGYPDCEPVFSCVDRLRFHPNLSSACLGVACLGVEGGWAPSLTLVSLIVSYYQLLTGTFNSASPMPDYLAISAARTYERLLHQGRLPFDTVRWTLPGRERKGDTGDGV